MKKHKVLALITAATMTTGIACAQNFPTRPIRIVTSGAGGGTDFAARLIAFGLTGSLGQQVIVDNRASGTIPGDIVSHAAPDGHTLLLATGILWLLPFLQEKVPYDPVKDFAPVTLAISSPNILVVHPAVATSVQDLITRAKASPGKLNYAMTAQGGGAHLAAELFKAMAGLNIVPIPYKSGGIAVNDIISGQIQMYFASAGSVVQHIKSGRMRGLGVTSAKPSAVLPDMPAIAATLPGYELESLYNIFAPAKTPAAIVNRLQQEIARVVVKPDIKDKLLASSAEPIGSTPQKLAETMKSEMQRMGKVIKDVGIRAE